MFESSKQQFSIGGLISVPDHLRKLDEQAFTPLLISIGPIHRSNPKLQTMKKCKVRFCEYFIERANINLQNLVHTIRDKEEEIRSYYAETVVSSISNDDFVTMIVVDGMFILDWYNFQRIALEDFNAKIEHFTGLVRFFYLSESEQLPYVRPGGAKLSYSATQLHEAGIKFKVAPEKYGRHFLDIRFDLKNGVLEIPCITLNDEKIRLIRNIIALEQSHYVGDAYVTDFFAILDFLIDNSKDVDLLCDKGILVNYLGDSNAAALAVNSLYTNILWDYTNPEYSNICEKLNAFYKKPWHRWRATLWHQYFSTPWRSTSTCIVSSSTAKGSGDLALDITTMFESSKQQFSIGGLISVPDHLRKLDEQAFTPLLISIGPIHRSNPKLQTMKKCKVRFCEYFIERANINLQNLVHTIRDKEEEIRSYYAETVVSSISNDDFVTMIVVDGMFILEYFSSPQFELDPHPRSLVAHNGSPEYLIKPVSTKPNWLSRGTPVHSIKSSHINQINENFLLPSAVERPIGSDCNEKTIDITCLSSGAQLFVP
ncbi:upf0481 protein [Quercus suber]|uniref:Upf0481 protein n=1 Tax=Quercus suber TaxID=58331 RepID=A0AAW0KGN6_QUESU